MLNIARQIYVGWDSTKQKYELPEAEVIPLGDSANEKRKLETIIARYPNLREHENIPLPGFTLHKTDRKNWGSVDQTWLVIDPRGFLVRISSQNLERILHVTGITEGLIQEECVWARENTETKMTLVPVSSSSYREAVRNTELIEGKIDMKQIQIGDTVLLQNKLQGRYLGSISLYGPVIDTVRNEFKPQVCLRRQVIEVTPNNYHYQTDLKILKVLEKTDSPMTRASALELIRKTMDISFFSSSSNMTGKYYGVRGKIIHASMYAAPKVSMSLVEISKDEAVSLFSLAHISSDTGMLLLEDHTRNRFIIDFPYYLGSGSMAVSSSNFDACKIQAIKDDGNFERIILESDRNFMSFGSFGNNIKKQPKTSLDKFAKFYKIVKHVKDEIYT